MENNSQSQKKGPFRPSEPVASNWTEETRPPISRAIVFAALAATGGGLDLWTKEAIFAWRGLPGDRGPHWIVDGILGIETAVNIGAVFGIGAGQGALFAALSIFAAAGILIWLFWFRAAWSWWLTVALGMVTGGIIGNLYDRLGLWWESGYPAEWQSGVRDWILFRIEGMPMFDPWPNFNIADSLLVVGAGMLLWHSLFQGPQAEGIEEQESDSKDVRKQASQKTADPSTRPQNDVDVSEKDVNPATS
ncbi:MAG: signal peptidase II [Planctomycetota bacterium]